MKATVYKLIDPRTNAVRYVGQTIFPLKKRLSGHLSDNCNKNKSAWIMELKNLGLLPIIEEIECVELAMARAAEQKWILHYVTNKSPLLNGNGSGIINTSLGRKKLEDRGMKKLPIRIFLENEIIEAHGGIQMCIEKLKNYLTKTATK